MHKIFQGINIVALDLMGVVLEEGSLVKRGLYSFYGDRYTEEYLKELYSNVRTNPEGDISLWKGVNEGNPMVARARFLDSFKIDCEFTEFREKVLCEGVRLGVISNVAKEWGEYFINKLELEKDFDPIVISGLIGMKKPDRDIYELFVTETNCKPEEIVFIDDKLRNLRVASEVGMKTVLFDRGWEQGGFVPDLVIRKFSELN